MLTNNQTISIGLPCLHLSNAYIVFTDPVMPSLLILSVLPVIGLLKQKSWQQILMTDLIC